MSKTHKRRKENTALVESNYDKINWNAREQDAQVIEKTEFTKEEICRAFGVPVDLLGAVTDDVIQHGEAP